MEGYTLPDGIKIDTYDLSLTGVVEDALNPLHDLAALIATDDHDETVSRGAVADLLEKLRNDAIDNILKRFREIEERIGKVKAIYAREYKSGINHDDLLDVEVIPPNSSTAMKEV